LDSFFAYSHLVCHLALDSLLALDSVRDLDVKITVVAGIGRALEGALDLVVFLESSNQPGSTREREKTYGYGQSVGSIEHGLLPVCVLCVGTGRELDGLVAA
jgi:hypothetical protein